MNDNKIDHLLQPREGVVGTDRDDWLLELDTRAVTHRDALGAMAYHLRSASLVGNPAPITKQVWDRISHPRVGDLVVETGVMFSRDLDDRLKGFGILLAHRDEYMHTDLQWEAVCSQWEGEPRPTMEAWYIQYGNAAVDICRWSNCDFLAIPTELREFR
jgi:hypothetical protein